MTYSATTENYNVSGAPLLIKFDSSTVRLVKNPRDFEVHVQVDSSGNLVGGVPGDDLYVEGWVDMNNNNVVDAGDYNGVLLTGEVSQFGYLDNGATDQYDFRFIPTGGLLQSLYAGKDLGLLLTSTNSTFGGTFSADFSGGASGTLGATDLLPAGSLSGNVYNDANNNGTLDSGEAGIGGVSVALTGTDYRGAAVSTSTTTLADGTYSFADLLPGNYTITETQPAGWLDGLDSVGTQGGTTGNDVLSDINLAPGVNGTDNNFGELALVPSSLCGYVYYDKCNDGTKNSGDPGIACVTITLSGTDYLGNSVSETTTTASDGSYCFMNLVPGTYTLTETQPSGWLDGKDTIGSQGGTTGNNVFSNIVLGNGVNGVNNNFGELAAACISGHVKGHNKNGNCSTGNFYWGNNKYRDGNWCWGNNGYGGNQGDWSWNGGNGDGSGICGVKITLTGTDCFGHSVCYTTTSDSAGGYCFGNLLPGHYSVSECEPVGWAHGFGSAGSRGGTAGNCAISDVNLNTGDDATDNNFDEQAPASVSGIIWEDFNGDGNVDFNEHAISGVTVMLSGTDSQGNAVSLTAVTDSDGSYAFRDLQPGTYTISETQPTGWTAEAALAGSLGGTAGTNAISSVTLDAGQDGFNYNFAQQAASGSAITSGQTATIGFWNGRMGQRLLESLNGSAYSTQLGNWLATSFPNLFGAQAGWNNLAGRSNAQVANAFQQKFRVKSLDLDAQVMALAFAVYCTNSNLAGGTMAASYGFIVNGEGTGIATFNVGSSGAAFGVANNTTMSVMDMLEATDSLSAGGNGQIYNGNTALRSLADVVYARINSQGQV